MNAKRFEIYCRDFPRVLDEYNSRAIKECPFESEYFDQTKYLTDLYGNQEVWRSISRELYTIFWVL